MAYTETKQPDASIRDVLAQLMEKSPKDIGDEDFLREESLILSAKSPRDELEKCINLKDFSIEEPQARDFNTISNLKKIKNLDIIGGDFGNKGDLAFLKDLPDLNSLYLKSFLVQETEVLSEIELDELLIFGGRFFSPSNLPSDLKALTVVQGEKMFALDASGIPQRWEIKYFDISKVYINPVESLTAMESLEHLVISERLINKQFDYYEKFKTLLSFSEILQDLKKITVDNIWKQFDYEVVRNELLDARPHLIVEEISETGLISEGESTGLNIKINFGGIS
jgi:hypothetical protein